MVSGFFLRKQEHAADCIWRTPAKKHNTSKDTQHQQRHTTPAKKHNTSKEREGRLKEVHDKIIISSFVDVSPEIRTLERRCGEYRTTEPYLQDQGDSCVHYDDHGQRHAPVLRNTHDLRTRTHTHTHTHTKTILDICRIAYGTFMYICTH